MTTRGVAISLFSGAGGLDLGVERAGYEDRAAVEWDRDAAATMEKNFLEAAWLAGLPLSAWTRERLRLAAIRELESDGQKIPFAATPDVT